MQQLKVAAPRNIYVISLVKLAASRLENANAISRTQALRREGKSHGCSDAAKTGFSSYSTRKFTVLNSFKFSVCVCVYARRSLRRLAFINAPIRRHSFNVYSKLCFYFIINRTTLSHLRWRCWQRRAAELAKHRRFHNRAQTVQVGVNSSRHTTEASSSSSSQQRL